MTRFYSATALGLILSAMPAVAEVTPQSVWEQMSIYFESSGLTVESANLEESGDRLTVSELILAQRSPESDLELRLADMVLTENGDGTVTIDMADESVGIMTMQVPVPQEEEPTESEGDGTAAEGSESDAATPDGISGGADSAATADGAAPEEDNAPAEGAAPEGGADSGEGTDGSDAAGTAGEAEDMSSPDASAGTEQPPEMEMQPMEVLFTIRTPGDVTTVREDGAVNVYEYLFPTAEVTLDKVQVGDDAPREDIGKLTLNEVRGTDRISTQDATRLQQEVQIVTADLTFGIEDEDMTVAGGATAAGIDITSDISIPEGASIEANPSGAMRDGLDASGTTSLAEFDANISAEPKNEEMAENGGMYEWSGKDLSVDFSIGDGLLRYAGSSGAMTAMGDLASLEQPVGYSAESSRFELSVPVIAKPEPQDFALQYGLEGAQLADTVWSMFDPQGALPRDPLSIALDLEGTATVDVDLFDSEAMAEPDVVPGQIHSLNIRNFALNLLGASAEVSGELDSPEGGNLSTPVGTLSGRFEGVNGLMDSLTQAGLVPQERMMGVRMMLMMFARADADNPEIMTTELEFREGGEIFANGQQVK